MRARVLEGKVEGCALGLGIEERETRGSGAGSSSPWLDAVYGDGAREETRESGGSGRGVRARVRRDWWGRLGLGLGPAREVGRPRLLGSSLSL